MAKLGIFGGTFNPPHLGHLICAQSALSQLKLDRVIFVPAADPPHKAVDGDPGPRQRLAMCHCAIEGNGSFAVSTVDFERPGPSYTATTLERLHTQFSADDLTLIIGGDMGQSFHSWHRPERIIELARLAVVEREDSNRAKITAAVSNIPDATKRLDFFEMPRIDISSTLVRSYVANGRPLRYLVPDRVARYIEVRRLYR